MTKPDRLPGFAPVEPSPALRARVIALRSASPVRWRDVWPFTAAAAVIVLTIVADRALDAHLDAAAGRPGREAPASLQPYDPSAPLPVSPESWASLRPAEVIP